MQTIKLKGLPLKTLAFVGPPPAPPPPLSATLPA